MNHWSQLPHFHPTKNLSKFSLPHDKVKPDIEALPPAAAPPAAPAALLGLKQKAKVALDFRPAARLDTESLGYVYTDPETPTP